MAAPPALDTSTRWEGEGNIQGFPHNIVLEYDEGVEVKVEAENEFFKMFYLTIPWAELAKLSSEDMVAGPRHRLTKRLLKCLTFEPNPVDNRKKILKVERPPERVKMVRRVKQSSGGKSGWVSPVALRKKSLNIRPESLIRHASTSSFRRTQLEEELTTYPIDLGVIEVNFVPHKMRAKVYDNGSIGFMGRDDYEKVVKVVADKEKIKDLLSNEPVLLRPGREEERVAALQKLLTYMDKNGDPRRKVLSLKKKEVQRIKMKREKKRGNTKGRSGRGDKIIIRDVHLMASGAAGFRRTLNSRAATDRARTLWGRVANNLKLVLHMDPGLSKCKDGMFKFNRSKFVGAAMLLQEAADLGCETRIAHPYKFWKQLGRAHYEAFRCTLMPEFLDKAHVALKRALAFLANLSSVDVWLHTGMVYVRHASWKGAAQVFARIIQDYPRYDAMNEVVYQAAAAMLQLGMLPQGLAYLQAVLGRPPKPFDEAHVQMVMGQVQATSGALELAKDTFIDVFNRLHRRKHSKHEARWARVIGDAESDRGRLQPRRLTRPAHDVLMRMKALDEELHETAIQAPSADVWLAGGKPWALLGQLFAARGDQVYGMMFFRKAFTTLSHTDRTPQVLLDAAQCHAATGDIATGVALAEEAKAQQDDLPFVDQCLKAWAPEKYGPATAEPEPDERLGTEQLRRAQSMNIIADKQRAHQHAAASTIQRVARGRAGRRKVNHIRERHSAATKIQSQARRVRDKEKVVQVRQQHQAAVQVQRVARGKQARAEVAKKRELRDAQLMGEAEAARVRAEREAEAARVKAEREGAAKKKEREEREAAVLREREEKRKQDKDRREAAAVAAAARKQAEYERKMRESEAEKERQRMLKEELRAKNEAACTIQRCARGHIARMKMHDTIHELRGRARLSDLQAAEDARRRKREAKLAAARLKQVEAQRLKQEAAKAAKEAATRQREEEARAAKAAEAARVKEAAAREAIAAAQAEAKARMQAQAAAEEERRGLRNGASVKIQSVSRGYLGRQKVRRIRSERATAEARRVAEIERAADLERRLKRMQMADAERAAELAAEMAFPTGGMPGMGGSMRSLVPSASGLGADMFGLGGMDPLVVGMPPAPLFAPPAMLLAQVDTPDHASGAGAGGLDAHSNASVSFAEAPHEASHLKGGARSKSSRSLGAVQDHRARSRSPAVPGNRGRPGTRSAPGSAVGRRRGRSRSKSPAKPRKPVVNTLTPSNGSGGDVGGGGGAPGTGFLPSIRSPMQAGSASRKPQRRRMEDPVVDTASRDSPHASTWSPAQSRRRSRRRSADHGSPSRRKPSTEARKRPNTTGTPHGRDGAESPADVGAGHGAGAPTGSPSYRENGSPAKGSPASRYTAMPSVRHLAFLDPSGDSGEVRYNTLRTAKRTGATGSVSEPYLRHWRRRLAGLLEKYPSLRKVRRAVAEVRSAQPTVGNEEAFCALADCDGDVRLTIGRLMDARFLTELQSLVRVVDVTGFVAQQLGTEAPPEPAPGKLTIAANGLPAVTAGRVSPAPPQMSPQAWMQEPPASPWASSRPGTVHRQPTVGSPSHALNGGHSVLHVGMREMTQSASLPVVGLRRPVVAEGARTPKARRRPQKFVPPTTPTRKFNPRLQKKKSSKLTAEQRAALISQQAGTAKRMMKGHSCHKPDCLDCMMARLQQGTGGRASPLL